MDEPKVTQNDAVTFVLRMTDDGVDYPLVGVSTYTLASLRPDGQSVLTVGAKTADNEITFELGSTEVSVPGNVKAAIQLYDVDGRVSSIPFTYEVTKDLVEGYIPSKDEQTLIELVLGQGPAILAAAEAATIMANDAATNADANAVLAQTSAVNADDKAQLADTAATNANIKAQLAEEKATLADQKATLADDATIEAIAATDAINAVLPNVEGLENKGEYNNTTTYVKNNLVESNGSAWQALQGTIGNPPPTLPTKSNAYWTLIAQRGVDGMGSVVSVNGEGPDVNGNVSITIPDPDLSGLATKTELLNLEDEFTMHLADNAISPDDFSGTDSQKVQQAINEAIAINKGVRFNRIFDITGNTISIDKTAGDRTALYLMGFGGGIKKNDVGYIFTSALSDTGDIYSTNMKYIGTTYNGGIVWDCNKLIRLTCIADSYQNLDTVAEAKTRWMQSCKFINNTITGNGKWAFEWAQSYDCLIEGNTIEHGINGIRNTTFTGDPDNNTLRIINNVIEGMGGVAISLGSTFGVSIVGNYMEENTGGYIVLNNSESYHNGLVISNNTIQQSSDQRASNTPAIKLGKVGNQGVSSTGNTATGILYETLNAGTPGLLISVGDVSYFGQKVLGNLEMFTEMGQVVKTTNRTSYGRVFKFFKSTESPFLSGEIKNVAINFNGITTLSPDDIAQVTYLGGSGSESIVVHSTTINTLDNSIVARIKNESGGNQNILIRVSVLQIK